MNRRDGVLAVVIALLLYVLFDERKRHDVLVEKVVTRLSDTNERLVAPPIEEYAELAAKGRSVADTLMGDGTNGEPQQPVPWYLGGKHDPEAATWDDPTDLSHPNDDFPDALMQVGRLGAWYPDEANELGNGHVDPVPELDPINPSRVASIRPGEDPFTDIISSDPDDPRVSGVMFGVGNMIRGDG